MMTKMLRALFVAWVVPFLAVGQERNGDPFNNPDFSPAKAEPQGPKTWEVMVEVYSVAFDEAAALRRELKVSSKLHAELIKQVDEKKAVLEELVVMKGAVTKRCATASFEEYLYPTAYEPADLPSSVLFVPKSEEEALKYMSTASPVGFTLQPIGSDLILTMKNSTEEKLGLELMLTKTALVERISWGQGVSLAELPKFEVSEVQDELSLKDGKVAFLGTMSPTKKNDGGKERRVRLVFATATAERK